MNSKERVRAAMEHKKKDRVPAAFEAVSSVVSKLLKHYGYTSYDQLLSRYQIDIVPVGARYIGPKLKTYKNEKGEQVTQNFWGFESTTHETEKDTYHMTSYYPLHDITSLEDAKKFQFPNPDWFDYSTVTKKCEQYSDKAIIIGHEGPFQMVTNLMRMEDFFMLMIDEPKIAHYILDGMVDFEMEHYKRMFEAGQGKIDVLRTHDDYGTQISLLFGMDLWKEFFEENTKRLVELAHSYGAFFQQHSCGAVRPLIPKLIGCGVDAIEPIQKVQGLEPETLIQDFGDKITFHGGIDTQNLLPFGTAKEVKEETERIIKILNQDDGYILMASQAFEGDVPIENIEAVYSACRD